MANNPTERACVGITIGFTVGLLVVYGVERFVKFLEQCSDNWNESGRLLSGTYETVETRSSIHEGKHPETTSARRRSDSSYDSPCRLGRHLYG